MIKLPVRHPGGGVIVDADGKHVVAIDDWRIRDTIIVALNASHAAATRAPSPCSADSSSEASAKEDATQGKPTDDARLTERLDEAVNALVTAARDYERYGGSWCDANAKQALAQFTAARAALVTAILAALRAAQAERDRMRTNYEDAINLASAAERERDAARAEASELRSEHVMTRLEQRVIEAERERDALREALILVLPMARGYAATHHHRINDECIEQAEAALAPRPPCSAEASQGKPVKEE